MVQTCFSLENYSSNPSNSSFVKIASVIFGRIFLLNKKNRTLAIRKHSFYFKFLFSVCKEQAWEGSVLLVQNDCKRSHGDCCSSVSVHNKDIRAHALVQCSFAQNIHSSKTYLHENDTNEWPRPIEQTKHLVLHLCLLSPHWTQTIFGKAIYNDYVWGAALTLAQVASVFMIPNMITLSYPDSTHLSKFLHYVLNN